MSRILARVSLYSFEIRIRHMVLRARFKSRRRIVRPQEFGAHGLSGKQGHLFGVCCIIRPPNLWPLQTVYCLFVEGWKTEEEEKEKQFFLLNILPCISLAEFTRCARIVLKNFSFFSCILSFIKFCFSFFPN